MDDVDQLIAVIIFLLGCLMGGAIGIGTGKFCEANRWERSAIKHGHASYEIVDPKTGKVEFRWGEK